MKMCVLNVAIRMMTNKLIKNPPTVAGFLMPKRRCKQSKTHSNPVIKSRKK